MLRQWAEEKYHLPWTHESLQEQTLLDLLTAYWEDYYRENKIEASRREDGEVAFETGDPYIDKWEKELAMGLEPDLLEGLPSWHREKITREQQRNEQLRQIEEGDDEAEFADDYSNLAEALPSSTPLLGRR